MGRLVSIGGGAVMLCAASQFPEYSQQYVQRLGGAVDELRVVAQDFDRSAQTVGLTRQAALQSMTGNAFQLARQSDMKRIFARLDRLEADYAVLQGADAFTRLEYLRRLDDHAIAARAWADFEPAVPLTADGFIFAFVGFLAGFWVFAGLGGIIRRMRKAIGVTP